MCTRHRSPFAPDGTTRTFPLHREELNLRTESCTRHKKTRPRTAEALANIWCTQAPYLRLVEPPRTHDNLQGRLGSTGRDWPETLSGEDQRRRSTDIGSHSGADSWGRLTSGKF